jgi:hypothetical protein
MIKLEGNAPYFPSDIVLLECQQAAPQEGQGVGRLTCSV